MSENYCGVTIRIFYVNGLVTECVRKNMEEAREHINTLNLKEVEEIKMFNCIYTKDFYDKIPDMKQHVF